MGNIRYERHDRLFYMGSGDQYNSRQAKYVGSNWHESLEIILVTDGTGLIYCDFEGYKVKKNEILIINSDVVHGFNVSDDDKFFKYHYLILSRDFCLENGLDISKVMFTELISDAKITGKYLNVVKAIEKQEPFGELAIRAAILELLYSLCNGYIKAETKKEGSKEQKVCNIRTAIAYIRENLSGKISIKELASASGISEYYFIREFKRITHFTPVTYINMSRCDLAKKLLSEGEYNVGEVADMCGFDNMPYFTKTFKRYIGVLPSEIKKN